MEMDNHSDETSTLEPPKHDMLHIKFRGDKHEYILPYCEVANGVIAEILENEIVIASVKPDEHPITLKYKEFFSIIEKTFDTKQITSLAVQIQGEFDVFKIL